MKRDLEPLRCVLVGQAAGWLANSPALEVVANAAPDEGIAVACELDADAVVLGVSHDCQADLVVAALAADLHVLLPAGWAMDSDERQRCVRIAQNRGLRLGVLNPEDDRSDADAAVHDWAMPRS